MWQVLAGGSCYVLLHTYPIATAKCADESKKQVPSPAGDSFSALKPAHKMINTIFCKFQGIVHFRYINFRRDSALLYTHVNVVGVHLQKKNKDM